MDRIRFQKEAAAILVTLLASFMSAFGLHYFVYSASFAPSGIDGIATMLRELTGINAGIFSLAFNLPLLVVAWFILKRRYVVYTLIFTVLSSVLLMLFELWGFPIYEGIADGLVAAAFSGVILGVRTGIMLRIGASSGGVDIMGSMIQKKLPRFRVERIILLISVSIIAVSLPVYRDPESVLLSIVEAFVCERVTAAILQYKRPTV